MPRPLFRKEALEQQRQSLEGALLIATSPRARLLALLAFGIALVLLTYIFIGEFNRKATVQGYLSPDKGLVKVFPQVIGTLLESRVEEGMSVRKGQVLAVVSMQRGSLQVRDANAEAIRFLQARLDSLNNELISRNEQNKLRQIAIKTQAANLMDELEQLDMAVHTVRVRLQRSREESQRFENLKTSGFVASSEVYRRQDISMDLRGKLQILERDRIALIGRQQALDNELPSSQLESDLQREALMRRIIEVKQQLADYQTNDEVVIAAPADGTVSTILIKPGQQTRQDAPLLSIIPDGARLEARLLVPSHAIGFITPGQEVALRYSAFPFQRFGHYRGTVDSIARTLLLPGDAELPTPLTTPAYLVNVELEKQSVAAYDKEFPLQAGMSVDGDVLLDRRTIFQWMFDPLFSMTRRS